MWAASARRSSRRRGCWWSARAGSARRWLLYLAAAGVGTIGVVDDDRVELSNLQRQIAHTTDRLGRPRRARRRRRRARDQSRGADRDRTTHAARPPTTPLELIARYDIVCDGTDNFATRFLVADACVLGRRTLVSAAVLRFEGQLSVFKPHRTKTARATAACTPNRRRTAWCRHAARPACSAR